MNDVAASAAKLSGLRIFMLAFFVIAFDAALLALALGGPAALLRHPRALALLASWGISSLALGTLRPARDPDVVDRVSEARLLPLVLLLIPLLTVPVSAACERAGFLLLPTGAWRWAGVALASAGLAIRIAAMAQLGRRFSPRLALQRDHALETRGLYSRIRHPGYLGSLLANLGGALAFGSWVGAIMVAALTVILRARTVREEEMLETRFGSEYRDYRARTGRFLPSLALAGRK